MANGPPRADSSTSLSRNVSYAVQMTLTDLFLSGSCQGWANEPDEPPEDEDVAPLGEEKGSKTSFVLTIPDPPSSVSTDLPRTLRENFSENDHGLGPEAKGLMATEHAVPDYWRDHAGLPRSWPNIKEAQRLQREFVEQCERLVTDDSGSKFTAYAVVHHGPVGLRAFPSTQEADLNGDKLSPGQCIVVNSVALRGGTRFLRLVGGGWAFEQINGAPVLAQLSGLELGPWWYRVVCRDFVETRRVPSCSNWARSGHVLCPGEVCVVGMRCCIGGRRFLQLADGRGWAFERTPGGGGASSEGRAALAECDGARPVADKELALDTPRIGKEAGLWQYQVLDKPIVALGTSWHGAVLEAGETFLVGARIAANGEKAWEPRTRRAPASTSLDGRTWLELNDGRGWIPKTAVDGKPLVQFVGVEAQLADMLKSVAHCSLDLEDGEESALCVPETGFV